jgi:hypothetical protein
VRILATIIALSLCSPALDTSAKTEDVKLSWKFKEGEVLRYRITQDMHQAISGPADIEIESSVAQVIGEKVKSISADGLASLECTWEAVKVHMNLPMGGDVDFDSSRGDTAGTAPGALKAFAGLPGSKFEIDMKANGEVTEVRGVSDTMKKILEGGDAASKGMRDMMQRAFTDEAMKRYLGTTVLPEKPVAVGDTWKRDTVFDMPPLGKLKAHFDFDLAGMESARQTPCAKLGTKFTMKLEGKPDLSSMPGAENFDIDMSIDQAEGEGTIHFSPEKGRVVESALVTDMDMSMTMKPKGEDKGEEGKMEMGIKLTMKTNLALLGADEAPFEAAAKSEAPPKKK